MIDLVNGDKELLKKVEEITDSKYIYDDTKIFREELMNALTDLLSCYEHLEEKFKDYVKDVDENYKAVTKEEQIYG